MELNNRVVGHEEVNQRTEQHIGFVRVYDPREDKFVCRYITEEEVDKYPGIQIVRFA